MDDNEVKITFTGDPSIVPVPEAFKKLNFMKSVISLPITLQSDNDMLDDLMQSLVGMESEIRLATDDEITAVDDEIEADGVSYDIEIVNGVVKSVKKVE